MYSMHAFLPFYSFKRMSTNHRCPASGGHANAASLLEEEPVKVFGFELKVNRRCDEVHQAGKMTG